MIEFERLLEDEIQFNVTNREMRALTKRFDSDGNGRVDRREFLEFCKQHGYRRPAEEKVIADIKNTSSTAHTAPGVTLQHRAQDTGAY